MAIFVEKTDELTMVVMDIMDVLEDLCEDQREFILKALIDQFSEVSRYVLYESQLEWDGTLPFEDFIKHQNKIIRNCVDFETSPFGKIVRTREELPPFTNLTEIII
ncbi:MAG: hypothetical protein WC055_16920 [Melioribacteraceae bacterium]